MDYFYSPPEQCNPNGVIIEGEEFAHLTHVMRKKEGDHIRVVNGIGTAFDVTITSLQRRIAYGQIDKTYDNHNESSIPITMAVGMLKNPSRFDFLIEKVTELGVQQIIPLHTSRTIPKEGKTDRWQKLALAAMKQSCRSLLPKVHDVMKLEECLASSEYNSKIVFHEKAENSNTLNHHFNHTSTTSHLILIGPEGGFSEDEIALCNSAGCAIASLGERRLRTETAAIVAVTLLHQHILAKNT